MPLTIYKSSAGSGKTYTLVKEYVNLLVRRPNEFRNILAITFTNKATDEMKGRIIEALSLLSDEKFEGLAKQLAKENPDIPASDIPKNAQTALQNILHNYSEFTVSTIDSFFQRILRANAKELKLPLRYEVEMDRTFVLDQITAHLMLDIGNIDGLTNWLEDFAFSQIEEDKGWNIERNIRELGNQIFIEEVWERLMQEDQKAQSEHEEGKKPKSSREIRELRYKRLKKIIEQLWGIKRDFEKKLKDWGKEAVDIIEGYGLKMTDFKAGTAVYFENIQKGVYKRGATLEKIYQGNTSAWCTKTAAKKAIIEQAVHSSLQDILTESIDYYNTNLIEYTSASEVLKNIYVYGILNDLKDKLRDYRTDNNMMLISDTNNVIREAVSDNDTHFIFEKIGIVYKHVLIDEFQDTSNYQWDNIKHIADNSISQGNFTLVVGDVKQSIYRWRGGNMQLLMKGVQEKFEKNRNVTSVQNLAHNWRSHKHVVAFNNAFFSAAVEVLTANMQIPEARQLVQAYESVKQDIQHDTGGLVKVEFLPSSGWKEEAGERMLGIIGELQKEGKSLKDIAILVRTNLEGSDIAEKLAGAGIKVISSESLLLKNSPKVMLLISILRYLSDHRDIIAKTEILVHWLQVQGKTDEIDHRIYTDHQTKNKEEDKEAEIKSFFQQLLPPRFHEDINNLVKKPLYELIELLIEVLMLNDKADAYIQRFQDLVLEHNSTKSADVNHFLGWWNDHEDSDKTSIIVPKGEDAVTIITIHKAKGLEFPIVVMPYCDWSLTPKMSSIIWTESDKAPFDEMGPLPLKFSNNLRDSYFRPDYEKELLMTYIDNLNVLYVAFTRPVERLYILTREVKRGGNLNSVYQLLSSTLQSDGFEYNEHFDNSTVSFALPQNFEEGDSKSSHKEETSEQVTPLSTYLCNDYQNKITIRSDSDRFFMLFDSKKSEAIKTGQKIHSVLEKMVFAKDLEKVMRQLQIQGILQAVDIPIIRERIKKTFQDKKVQSWFSNEWEVLAERRLLRNQDSYIPDRVLIKDNQAIVIDYKTGKNDNKHKRQVNRYAQILEGIGYQVTEKYLLYVGEDIEIVEVV
ncbi:MAG: UvrD-helicase domain-containing protein, partial [Chitinophagales bacterium]